MKPIQKALVTLFFEGAKHLTKVRDKVETELSNVQIEEGIFGGFTFAGCKKFSVDVELQEKTCKLEFELSQDQVEMFPSRTVLKSIGIDRRRTDATSRWNRLSFDLKARLHAEDRANDKGAKSFTVQIQTV